jgi:hypothetical protein
VRKVRKVHCVHEVCPVHLGVIVDPTAPTPPPAPPVSPLPPQSAILSISVLGDMWIPTTSAPVQMTARVVTSRTPFEWVDGTGHVAWSSLANAAATLMSGAFTQYEPRSTLMTPPYRCVVRTEHEFANLARAR